MCWSCRLSVVVVMVQGGTCVQWCITTIIIITMDTITMVTTITTPT